MSQSPQTRESKAESTLRSPLKIENEPQTIATLTRNNGVHSTPRVRMGALNPWFTTRPKSSARVKYSQKYFFECEKALILLDFLALGVFSVKNKSPHPMCYFRTNSLYSRLFSFQRRSWATACVSFPAPSTYYLSCVFGFFKTSLSTWLEVATLMHIAIFHCTGSFSKVPAKMFPIFQVMSSSLEQ